MLRSFLTKGNIVEMISAENVQNHDDAYIQGVRDEITGKSPFGGRYARKMGLFHIATRRVSPYSDRVLWRTTGPKKIGGVIALDDYGRPTYFPRMYILRMVTDAERNMNDNDHTAYRKKVLSTIAHILHRHEERKNKDNGTTSSPRGKGTTSKATPPPKASVRTGWSPTRQFSPTKFHVPESCWDATPDEPGPLDWYITDQMVSTAIQSMYLESEVGGWHMFSENVGEADCFFSPPYTYVAETFGFRNPGESSVREPIPNDNDDDDDDAEAKPLPRPAVEQAFDAGDVLPLE